jgi:hypothetical protein
MTVPVALKQCNMWSFRVRGKHTLQAECLKDELCVVWKDHLLRFSEKDRMHVEFVREMSQSTWRRCDDTITMHSGKKMVRMECGHRWLRPVSISRLYCQHCQAFKAWYHSTSSHITTLYVHNSHTAPFEWDSIYQIGVWLSEVNGRHRTMHMITQHNMITTTVNTFCTYSTHFRWIILCSMNEWIQLTEPI